METNEVQLTEEMKEKLRSSLGFDVNSEFKYVPADYRQEGIPKEVWSIWNLTSKDGVEIAELEDQSGEMIYDDSKKETRVKLTGGSMRLKTLENGIVSVKRHWIENGSYINYDKKRRELVIVKPDGKTETNKSVTTRDFLRYVPAALQIEIQDVINERKTLTEEELRGLE